MRKRTLMDVAARLKASRAEVLRIAAQNGASNVRIFGSVARGEAKPDSDIVYLLLRLESVAAAFAQKCPLLPLLHQSGAVRTGLVPDA